MKRIIAFSLLIVGVLNQGFAAAPVQRRGQSSAAGATAETAPKAVSARVATTRTSSRSSAVGGTTARGATRSTVSRSATTVAPTVRARAGATQKVINSGTKVAGATKNIIVSDECRQKYEGCMDAFCMLDNESGGRCLCSDKNQELDEILAQIEALDNSTYQMATYGVEKIEMGDAADEVIRDVNSVTESLLRADNAGGTTSLDTSAWNVNFEEDGFFVDDQLSMTSIIDDKTGANLHTAAADLCAAQIPECAAEMNMLQLMYSQQIKSDCAAYENSLKQRKIASQEKLNVATKALRDAALKKHREQNKYDLGQCEVEFRTCMQRDEVCGSNFTKCATVFTYDVDNEKTHKIQGTATTIEIWASTYDTLLAKRPMCEHVTQQCVKHKDDVWGVFLAEVAPTLKSVEITAENDMRMNCLSNISDCFRNACQDNFDVNDADGSYDLCLTRPEAMLDVCKIPLEACGIKTTDKTDLEGNNIWNLVKARLAGMRVDACTTQIKECMQSEDRCGPDYSQCIGLDAEEIINMCPYEKLVSCQGKYGETEVTSDKIYDQISDMIAGLIVNIDNSALTTCQRVLDEAMLRVCGDTESCDAVIVDDYIGANTLSYSICDDKDVCYKTVEQMPDDLFGRVYNATRVDDESGNSVPMTYDEVLSQTKISNFVAKIDGEIAWDKVDYILPGEMKEESSGANDRIQLTAAKDASGAVVQEIAILNQNIENAIAAIEADQKVQYCLTGRKIKGTDGKVLVGGDTKPFPNLTHQIQSIIATSALKVARDNYYAKFDELNKQMQQDFVKIAARIAEAADENQLLARREAASEACLGYAKASTLPMMKLEKLVNPVVNDADYPEDNYTASSQIINWNYKETVTTTFNEENLVCRKCTRTQNCLKPKGGRKLCKQWADPVEECVDTQF